MFYFLLSTLTLQVMRVDDTKSNSTTLYVKTFLPTSVLMEFKVNYLS